MRKLILQLMAEIAENADCFLAADIQNDTVLLESSLDPRGLAILVARLEEELCRDPFTETENIVYPLTLGKFVAIYGG